MRILTLLFLLLFSHLLLAASITAQTDRSSIGINESFSLILEATGSVDDDPDFTPLEQDFDILNRSQSSNISYINGNYSRTQTWTLQLMAKREGVLNIPSLSFGKDTSPQIRIMVKPAGKTDPATQDIFIEAEVSTSNAYVQQQIVFTLRLLTAVNLSGVNFSDLKTENIDTRIEALNDGKQYRTQRGNRTYLVVEKQYALFPQQSGTLHIPSLLVEATLGARAQSLFDPFNRSAQIQRFRSKTFDISINNIPAGYQAKTWLPATELQLVEEWPDKTELKAGEPITRTISILANGLTAEQLPELMFNDVPDIKQYPDQASLNNSKQDDGIIGIRQQKIALIPVKGGSYTLPAIQIPWWNVKTSKMEIAQLAERSFKVARSPASAQAQAPLQNESAVNDTTPDDTTETIGATVTSTDSNSSYGLWLSLFFATGWLATGLGWWLSSPKQPSSSQPTQTAAASSSLKHALKQLHTACDMNDASACRNNLLAWGKAVFGDHTVHTLEDVATLSGLPQLQEQIRQLNHHLYSPQGASWQGQTLWQIIQQFKSDQRVMPDEASSLEPLYKLTG
ncbi:MAG: protein BatD [Gammaproteobacteria bacterium]|nr:MAG: protein BatD [Gammaproteobacteria bacterium]